jgi:hypothetical protein
MDSTINYRNNVEGDYFVRVFSQVKLKKNVNSKIIEKFDLKGTMSRDQHFFKFLKIKTVIFT